MGVLGCKLWHIIIRINKQVPVLSECCESLLRAAVLVLEGGELKH